MGFVAARAVGPGYKRGVEWPLVYGGNGGCCGACQADGLLRAWGKAPPLHSLREKCSQPPGPGWTPGLSTAWPRNTLQHIVLVLPCCLGSGNINYKIVVGRRTMLGKGALLCASAELEYGNDVGGVEDLLPFQASLTDIRTGDKTPY